MYRKASAADLMLKKLDLLMQESQDIIGAVSVLHDQATSHFCGVEPNTSNPLSHGDVLEIAVAVCALLTPEQIRGM